MAQFVKSRAMPVDRLMEIVGPWHRDIVMPRAVISGRATDAKIGARRGNQFLGVRQDQAIRDGRRWETDMFGQVVTLVDREHREMLEERNPATGCGAFGIRSATFAAGHKAAGVDDTDTAFAATHRAPQGRSLPERQEGMAREASGDDGMPEGKHIDATVSTGTDSICAACRCPALAVSPGLNPWDAPSLEISDDPVGDLLVKIDPLRV